MLLTRKTDKREAKHQIVAAHTLHPPHKVEKGINYKLCRVFGGF